MINGTRRFFKENGDPQVQRIFAVATMCALALLPLGALKGDLSGATVGALVLEVALGVLYVLFCVNNRRFANYPAATPTAADVEATAQMLGGSPVTSEGYIAASRG